MDALFDEVESLEAILMEDVHVTRNKQSIPEIIETTIFPVISEDGEQQSVCVTLQVLPTARYPEESPNFKLFKPRGLDDTRLEAIRIACALKIQELLGCPVVFDLIETIRELLTGSNLPSGQCVVCLYGFTDGDEFTRTECFHFLHSYCLGRHLNAMRRNYQEEYEKLPTWLQKKAEPFKPLCPVCREAIKDECDSLKCAMPPAELQNAPNFKITNELREMQQRMAALYLQQKERGGIIDTDAEKGAVISIESEQELRRRLRRESRIAANRASTGEFSTGEFADDEENNSSQRQGLLPEQMSEYASIAYASSSRNCANSQTQSKAQSEVTENSKKSEEQQGNLHKRYYRGGRRHQYHQQQQQRENRAERERERFEYNHGSNVKNENSHMNNNNNSNGKCNVKHTKANAVGVTQNR